MSRTEAILAAVTAELRRRQRTIDTESGLLNVVLTVKMDSKAGRPREVWTRLELKPGTAED